MPRTGRRQGEMTEPDSPPDRQAFLRAGQSRKIVFGPPMAAAGWEGQWQFLLPRVGFAGARSDQKVNKLLLFRCGP